MQKLNFPEIENLPKIAVAVSGGADSMALTHMLSQKTDVLAITVDHGLRPESADEAAQIGKWLKKWSKVEHLVLRWDGVKPKTGKMDAARQARYKLLADACKTRHIPLLAVGHHADDQAETFFMRVAHGSGLDGLAGMKRLTPYNNALQLYRPLLGQSHADLVAYCRAHKIKWVEDPSNGDVRYTRARLRAALVADGFDARRMGTTLARLERAGAALAALAHKAAVEAQTPQGYDLTVLKTYPFEVFLRVLRAGLEAAGKGTYGPRLERLEVIAAAMYAARKRTRATLAGCIIDCAPRRNLLQITRETS